MNEELRACAAAHRRPHATLRNLVEQAGQQHDATPLSICALFNCNLAQQSRQQHHAARLSIDTMGPHAAAILRNKLGGNTTQLASPLTPWGLMQPMHQWRIIFVYYRFIHYTMIICIILYFYIIFFDFCKLYIIL